MAHAYHDEDNVHRELVEFALDSVRNGKTLFPLSIMHCMELHKIKKPETRAKLASFFALLSEGWFLGAWHWILEREIYNALLEFYSLPGSRVDFNPVRRGVFFAFGGFEWVNKELGWTEDEYVLFNEESTRPRTLLSFLQGGDEPSLGELRSVLEKTGARYSAGNRRYRDEKRQLSPSKLRRLRAGEIFLSIQDLLILAHDRIGLDHRKMLEGGPDRLVSLICRIPSTCVDLELGLQREKQWNRDVVGNDLYDFGHLNLAIPYCDVVITEKLWTELAGRASLHSQFETRIESRLDSLREVMS